MGGATAMTLQVRIEASIGCAVRQEPGAFFIFPSIVITALSSGSAEHANTRAYSPAARPRHRATPPANSAGRGR